MIKKITYLTLLIAIVLIGLNLVVSHALATDGEELTQVSVRSQNFKENVGCLRRQMMETQSLTNVSARAQSLGFINSIRSKVINHN